MSAEQALDKIRSEMTSNASNGYAQAVGSLLLLHLEEHPEDAQYVLSANKTILKSLEAMRKVAEKRKVDNYAVLTDAEGFAIVLDYFRSAEPARQPAVEAPQPADEEPQAAKPKRQSKPKPKPEPEPEPEDEEDLDFDALLL